MITEAINKLSLSLKVLKKLSRIPDYDKTFLEQQMAAVEKSRSLLVMYRQNLLKQMVTELQQLLNHKGIMPLVEVSSQQLGHIGQIMNNTGGILDNRSKIVDNLMPPQPGRIANALLIAQITEYMRSTIQLVKRFSELNKKLIMLVGQWKNNRLVHEHQVVLN
jgi:hypothetical protein